MFSLPRSFSDSTPVSLSLEDFFNPAKNDYYIHGRKHLTMDEWEAALRAVFTKDNILNNLEEFFPGLHFDGFIVNTETMSSLLSNFDDDDMWLLGLIHPSYVAAGNKIVWQQRCIRVLDYSSSRIDISLAARTFECNYSFNGSNFANEMRGQFLSMRNEWNTIKANYPRHYINSDYFGGATHATQLMMKYISNRKIYHQSDLSPETLLSTLLPDTRIRVNFSGGGSRLVIYNPVTRANKTALHRTLSYSADVLELLPWPIITKGEKEPLLYGVELEVSTRYETPALIDACDEPFFACKQDSSITGSMRNKVELVTAPTSLKAHKAQWSHFFSNLDYDQFDTTIETNNGMHVHIGRVNFTDAHLRSFAWFFGNPSNKDFIVALSERKESHMHKYSALPDSGNNSRVRALKKVVDHFDMLRGAVNLHKQKPTVEVRIFKGIASYATILKNLEAVDAIYHFTQQCSQTNGGLKQFLNFLRKTPRNKYSVLKEFIATLDTKRMLSAAELNDLVFNVSDPRKIVSIISAKKFPITSHHVTILNQKQGVRTFIYNKELGTVEVVRTKHGKMSHLDRVLERRYVSKDKPPSVPPPVELTASIHGNTTATYVLDDLIANQMTAADVRRARDALTDAAPSNGFTNRRTFNNIIQSEWFSGSLTPPPQPAEPSEVQF